MPYVIRVDPHLYNGRGLTALRRDDDHAVFCLANKEDAEALVRMLDAPVTYGGYVLGQNQYARPEHTVVEAARKYPVRSLRDAMCALYLQYDFREDGTRIKVSM